MYFGLKLRSFSLQSTGSSGKSMVEEADLEESASHYDGQEAAGEGMGQEGRSTPLGHAPWTCLFPTSPTS